MIRYTMQLMEKDCVPAAFANLLKWSGQKFSYRQNRHRLYKMFKTSPDCGTDMAIFDKVISKKSIKGLKIKRKINLTYKEILAHIKEGGIVFFTYKKHSGNYHAALVVEENFSSIKVINHHPWDDGLVSLVDKKEFKMYAKRHNIAYLVTKIAK